MSMSEMMLGLIAVTFFAALGAAVWQFTRVRQAQRRRGEQPGEAVVTGRTIDARQEQSTGERSTPTR
jgi:hypothetical protein